MGTRYVRIDRLFVGVSLKTSSSLAGVSSIDSPWDLNPNLRIGVIWTDFVR